MKAIVADLLLGSVFAGIIVNAPVRANTPIPEPQSLENPVFLSPKVLDTNFLPLAPLDFNFPENSLNYFLSLENTNYINNVINLNNLDNWLFNENSLTPNLKIVKQHNLALEKKPFYHQNQHSDLILGFHSTFWPSDTGKYWGLTAIEQWGEKEPNQTFQLQLNKINSLPLLPEGTSTLTVSGGGGKNLVQKDDLLGEFEDFRGGIAFHRGVSEDLTLGMGFVYDEFLLGFTQVSYQPSQIPLQANVSLLSRDQGLELHSHVRFQPADNFVFNFYSEDSEQKFDLNWGIISGLTLTAKGNTEKESLQTGVKFDFNSDHFSLSARAGLDLNENWQWSVNSQFARFQLKYASKPLKTNSEISYAFLSTQDVGFQCSLFFQYETRQLKRSEEYLNVWGGRVKSGKKLGKNKYRWTFDLGYGVGSQGTGIIAATTTAIKPNLFIKLSYQEISVTSDEPKFKLEIGSH